MITFSITTGAETLASPYISSCSLLLDLPQGAFDTAIIAMYACLMAYHLDSLQHAACALLAMLAIAVATDNIIAVHPSKPDSHILDR